MHPDPAPAPRGAREHEGLPLLILMCGLPGSGKSTVSRILASRLGAPHWDKDALRDLLFPPGQFDPDRAINDLCMELLYAAALRLLRQPAQVPAIVLDGRPFTLQSQRRRAREAAAQAGAQPVFVLCSAPLTVLRARVASGTHPAADRSPSLVERLAAEMEPFDDSSVIRLDTAALAPDEAADRCVEALRDRGLRR